MLAKAAGLPADEVVIDLEDAVAASAKDEARIAVVSALAGGQLDGRTVAVRVNGAVVTLVAHEPLLGELAAVLMAGFGAPAQPLKKGAAVAFSSEHGVIAGGMELRWWLTPKLLRLLAIR